MPKKPKLSPEEQKRLIAEKKILKRLAIDEGKRQFKRDKLSREIKAGQLNRKKLSPKWQKMLRDIKIPELKIELELARNNIELILDVKDNIISLLMDELDDSEEKYAIYFRKHCENIQNLYKIYLTRLHTLKEEYDKELLYLHYSLRQQLAETQHKSVEAETYIKTMSYRLNEEDKYVGYMGRSLYMSKKNEEDAKQTDTLNLKKNKDEAQFEDIWKSFVNHLEHYISEIKETEKDYDERFKRDSVLAKIITKQTDEIFQHVNLLKLVKDRQVIEKEKLYLKMKELCDEQEYMQNIFLNLKSTLSEDVKYDEKVITNMVVTSNKQIEHLESVEILAEKILRLYSIVRKYETQLEKIFPFPKLQRRKHKLEKEIGNITNMTLFYQKCAQADRARNNISDEYLHLLEENYSLKRTVKTCLNYNCNKKVPLQSSELKNKFMLKRIRSITSASDMTYRL